MSLVPVKPPSYRPPGYRDPKTRRDEADRRRRSSTARGYDGGWRKVRLAFLAAHPLCAFCEADGRLTAATVVDHEVAIVDAPERRLDWSNLRPLCKPCHDRRTATEQGFARPGRGGRGGW